MKLRTATFTVIASVSLVAASSLGPPHVSAVALTNPASWYDFNDDGNADLAIGAPGDTVNGRSGAGSISVLYGGPNGLVANGSDLFDENNLGLISEANDHFGSALAAGDFDGDGFGDLAVGVPGEDEMVSGTLRTDIGRWVVIRGSSTGLTTVMRTRLGAGAGSMAGAALAALDCRGTSHLDPADGVAELAIGMPGDNSGTGRVQIYSPDDGEVLPGFVGTQAGERFGASLAAGYFDEGTGGHEDLAIGSPLKNVGSSVDAGSVLVIMQPCRVSGPGAQQQLDKSHADVPGDANGGDQFGFSLATQWGPEGAYLWVGVPFDDVRRAGGAISVANSGAAYRCNVPLSPFCTVYTEGSSGFPDADEAGDNFGWSLAIGNFGRGDGNDVAVGVPGEAVNGHVRAGAVDILYSDGTAQQLTQDSINVANEANGEENFGRAIFGNDFGDGSRADLAVGIPDETLQGFAETGAVAVFYGRAGGLTGNADKLWHRGVSGVRGDLGASDHFGAALD